MCDETPALVPVETRPLEIVHPPLVEPPDAVASVAAATPERIHLVDAAFTSSSDRQDSMVGLVGLVLTSPWAGDVLADHFRVPPDDEEDTPRKCH